MAEKGNNTLLYVSLAGVGLIGGYLLFGKGNGAQKKTLDQLQAAVANLDNKIHYLLSNSSEITDDTYNTQVKPEIDQINGLIQQAKAQGAGTSQINDILRSLSITGIVAAADFLIAYWIYVNIRDKWTRPPRGPSGGSPVVDPAVANALKQHLDQQFAIDPQLEVALQESWDALPAAQQDAVATGASSVSTASPEPALYTQPSFWVAVGSALSAVVLIFLGKGMLSGGQLQPALNAILGIPGGSISYQCPLDQLTFGSLSAFYDHFQSAHPDYLIAVEPIDGTVFISAPNQTPNAFQQYHTYHAVHYPNIPVGM